MAAGSGGGLQVEAMKKEEDGLDDDVRAKKLALERFDRALAEEKRRVV